MARIFDTSIDFGIDAGMQSLVLRVVCDCVSVPRRRGLPRRAYSFPGRVSKRGSDSLSRARDAETGWPKAPRPMSALGRRSLHRWRLRVSIRPGFEVKRWGVDPVPMGFGVELQNFPEGVAVSMRLRGERMSRLWSFWYGQPSALVEPVADVAAEVIYVRLHRPYAGRRRPCFCERDALPTELILRARQRRKSENHTTENQSMDRIEQIPIGDTR
jgi:hypothetical protein